MPKKELEGIVINNRVNKTVTVLVVKKIIHRKYKKIINRTKKYLAHDETNVLKIGDRVLIVESSPISKLKKWRAILKNTEVL